MEDLTQHIDIGATPPSFESLLTLGLYTTLATVVISVLLFLAWFLGRRTRQVEKDAPYESGVAPTGSARLREPVPFFLVAIFFIVFDVEAIFIVSWAVAYDLLGWAGFIQITVFIIILFYGLVYLWKSGALDWGPRRNRVIRHGDE